MTTTTYKYVCEMTCDVFDNKEEQVVQTLQYICDTQVTADRLLVLARQQFAKNGFVLQNVTITKKPFHYEIDI
jgi:hypothetical protein